MVWHMGILIGLAILFGVAGAYFKNFYLIAIAAVFVVAFLAEIAGVNLGDKRCDAKEKAVNTFVNKTVKSTETPQSKAAPDPWNSPKN